LGGKVLTDIWRLRVADGDLPRVGDSLELALSWKS
jgi:hypothetical protein